MVIEFLKFRVPAEHREKFIQKDEEIWNPLFSKHPGFLGKEIWISPDDLTEVVIVIHWQDKEFWEGFSQEEVQLLEKQFDQSLGFDYETLVVTQYQVRKYSQK